MCNKPLDSGLGIRAILLNCMFKENIFPSASTERDVCSLLVFNKYTPVNLILSRFCLCIQLQSSQILHTIINAINRAE